MPDHRSTSQLFRLIAISFFSGVLLPFGFAPFHCIPAPFISLALLYTQLNVQLRSHDNHYPWITGLCFGLGYFGVGTSWVFVSIHEYGHLNALVSGLITLCFILYLSLFPAIVSYGFKRLSFCAKTPFETALLFSALWIGGEYLRSTLFGGFPWLALGFSQLETPLKYLLPIVGVSGVGFLTCLSSTFFACAILTKIENRRRYLYAFVSLLTLPLLLSHQQWTESSTSPLSVGIIQANLSMRDKWDNHLFWKLIDTYKRYNEQLSGTPIIVMPESAIPLPSNFIEELLVDMDTNAKKTGSAIILGIPQTSLSHPNHYFNAMIGLGLAQGQYFKRHLVPFGEYIPKPFKAINRWLGLPETNLIPGHNNQTLMKVRHYPIASLICYELAYGDLLREQLPEAEWIISITDAGWFGESLAVYQQIQMAQVRSMESQRYQIFSNNDGLSSVINSQGEIIASLPAFHAGVLKSTILPMTGLTPWTQWGDYPALFISLVIILYHLLKLPIAAKGKRGYATSPTEI